MAYSQKQYEIASRRTGVPVALLKLVDGQEGNGVSPAGARGEMQLMPGTARGLERKYKINTRTRMGNLLGGAYYLKEQFDSFKSWRLALAAYNAGPNAVKDYDGVPPYHETQNYVSTIMRKYRAATKGSRAPANTTPGIPASSPGLPPGPPGIDKRAAAFASSQDIAGGHYDPVDELQRIHEQFLAATQAPAVHPAAQKPLPHVPGEWEKYVVLRKGADRGGMKTQPEVLQFVGQLGARVGNQLTIGTGTNHNRMTVNGNVSDHWSGHAADIPSSGKALLHLGRQALIMAGMDPKKAAKIKGGLFNIGRYQIIFLTKEGGNHFNHLHIGIQGGK